MTKQALSDLQTSTGTLVKRVASLYDFENPIGFDVFQTRFSALIADFEQLDILGNDQEKASHLKKAQMLADELVEQDFNARKREVWAVTSKIGKELMAIVTPLRDKIYQLLENKDYTE